MQEIWEVWIETHLCVGECMHARVCYHAMDALFLSGGLSDSVR